MAAKKTAVSYRWRAFHFCQWADKRKSQGMKVTIAACYEYMHENKMIRSPWRARQLRDDWVAYCKFLVDYESGNKMLE